VRWMMDDGVIRSCVGKFPVPSHQKLSNLVAMTFLDRQTDALDFTSVT
jgi:hypothetical protein